MKPVHILFFLLALNFASCDIDTKNPGTTLSPDPGNWDYTDNEDRMTSKKTYFATLKSNDQINSSYASPGSIEAVYPKIIVQGDDAASDVLISLKHLSNDIYDGRFYYNTDPHLLVRFDHDKPIDFSCTPTDDGNKNVLFINSSKLFISKLKLAQQVLIEVTITIIPPHDITSNKLDRTLNRTRRTKRVATVTDNQPYQEKKILEFNVSGLKWDHCCRASVTTNRHIGVKRSGKTVKERPAK